MRIRQLHHQRGSAIITTLILIFIMTTITLTLITSSRNNYATISGKTDAFKAQTIATTASAITVERINDFLTNPSTTLDYSSGVFAISGNGKSISDPKVADGTDPATAGSNEARDNSIEKTIALVKGGAPLTIPSDDLIYQQPDGYFYALATQMTGGSWEIKIRAKWRQNIKRIRTVLIPEPGVPFEVGIYAKEQALVEGEGVINFTNSDNPNDTEPPTVLEAGQTLFVEKKKVE